MLKKIDRARLFLEQHSGLFACPICHHSMNQTLQGLICTNGHRYDLSKKGTLYFLKSQLKSDYDANLFFHRAKMIQGGMYQPLLALLAPLLEERNVLDIGCGEGSFLASLQQLSSLKAAIGFDIAKEGIYQASNHTTDTFWCVADLTNLPFANQSFDVILNIFSPSNYHEFKRVLAPGGRLIKVIPDEKYLFELRKAFYPNDEAKQQYSNHLVVEKLLQAFPNTRFEKIQYQFAIPKELQASLLEMSPLEWGVSLERKAQLKAQPLAQITIDLLVAISENE